MEEIKIVDEMKSTVWSYLQKESRTLADTEKLKNNLMELQYQKVKVK